MAKEGSEHIDDYGQICRCSSRPDEEFKFASAPEPGDL